MLKVTAPWGRNETTAPLQAAGTAAGLGCWEQGASARGSELSVLPTTRGQSPLWEASQWDSTGRGSFSRASSHSWQGEGGRSYPAAARCVSPVSKPHADLQMISPAREQQICFILLLPFRACCQPTQTPGPRVPQAGCCSAPQLGNKICSTKLRAASPAEQRGTAAADG